MTVAFFKIQFDAGRWPHGDGPIEGHHPYSIPLINCPFCSGFRGKPAVSYPWIEVKAHFSKTIQDKLNYNFGGDLSWDEFQEIRRVLRSALGPNWIFPPSANFGHFRGKVFAKPPVTDVVMADLDVLLASKPMVEKWKKIGVDIRVHDVKLRQPAGKSEAMVELWAPPVARLGAGSPVCWCDQCDRATLPDRYTLDPNSVPPGTHLFLMKDCPFLVASEKLAELLLAESHGGFTLEPLPSE